MTRSRVIRPERDQQSCVVDPTLSELLEDSLVRLLMASDGVEPRSVWSLFTDIANQHVRFSKWPALPEVPLREVTTHEHAVRQQK